MDSDDEEDEGELDEWEDPILDSDDEDDEGDSDETEPECKVIKVDGDAMWLIPKKIVDERMSFEGKIEDVGEPEEFQANDNSPIPTEDDDDDLTNLQGGASHKTATTPGIDETPQQQVAQLAVAVEVDGGCGKQTHASESAITMPYGMQTEAEKAREDLQMAESTRKAEEDQAMAEWLSDLEDDDEHADQRDWATEMTRIADDPQIWNMPVEGKRKIIDERVDEEGNQPIPKPTRVENIDWPTTPQLEDDPNKELLPAQLEEQRKNGGTTASGERDGGIEKKPTQEYYSNVIENPIDPDPDPNDESSWGDPRKNDRKREGPIGAKRDAQDGREVVMRRRVESRKLEDKPEKERGCRSKVAGEKWPTAIAMNDVEEPEPPNISLDESRGRGGEAISWDNPRKYPEDDMKSMPVEKGDNTKSIPRQRNDAKSIPRWRATRSQTPTPFDGADLVSMLKDPKDVGRKGEWEEEWRMAAEWWSTCEIEGKREGKTRRLTWILKPSAISQIATPFIPTPQQRLEPCTIEI